MDQRNEKNKRVFNSININETKKNDTAIPGEKSHTIKLTAKFS